MDKWQDIRERGIGKQEPIKQISRETGVAINTIRKCLRSSSPPERRGAPTRISVMTAYENDVDALLKQEPRITAARVAQFLREKDPAFALRERAVRVYVARRRMLMHPKEVFIRQVYVPGDQTQYDFKDVVAIIAGEKTDLHLFTARLSHSTAWFGHCYRTEDRPALLDGFLRAAVEFNGVTRDGVFDNPKTAVIKVLRGRHRKVNAEFAAFTGSLAIDMQFAAPAKGNEKGGVEGAHGVCRGQLLSADTQRRIARSAQRGTPRVQSLGSRAPYTSMATLFPNGWSSSELRSSRCRISYHGHAFTSTCASTNSPKYAAGRTGTRFQRGLSAALRPSNCSPIAFGLLLTTSWPQSGRGFLVVMRRRSIRCTIWMRSSANIERWNEPRFSTTSAFQKRCVRCSDG